MPDGTGESDFVVELLECDLKLHVEFEGLRRLGTVDDVGHHARPFSKFDHGNGVRRREAGSGPMVNDVAVERRVAAGAKDADLARRTGRTEGTGRKIDVRAIVTALKPQFAGLCSFPEMFGLRRGQWAGTRGFSHMQFSPESFEVFLLISVHLVDAIIRRNGQAEGSVAKKVLVYRKDATAVFQIGPIEILAVAKSCRAGGQTRSACKNFGVN